MPRPAKKANKKYDENGEEAVPMTYKGIVKGNVIELEGEAALPEGTRVNIIPEQPFTVNVPQQPMTLLEWLREAREVQAQLPETSDSVEILQHLRVCN